jgi:hypothetical protein
MSTEVDYLGTCQSFWPLLEGCASGQVLHGYGR